MLKKAASLIKRFIRELKKIDNHMDSVIEYLLILFSNEPYWKREDFVQAQTVPIKDPKKQHQHWCNSESEISSSLRESLQR